MVANQERDMSDNKLWDKDDILNLSKSINEVIKNEHDNVYNKCYVTYAENEKIKDENIFPTIYPNWDTTPRLGVLGQVLKNSSPVLFKKHVKRIINMVNHKTDNNRVVFLKSWNEWAEGNYMEPDLRFRKGYIIALKEALDDNK